MMKKSRYAEYNMKNIKKMKKISDEEKKIFLTNSKNQVLVDITDTIL